METITETFANYYFHVPYCETKCHYCDFFSLPEAHNPEQERLRIYDAICRELSLLGSFHAKEVDTIFFGGGTPSLAPPRVIESILKALPIGAQSEITMEGNPSSINFEKARIWRGAGVNRFSMGVQALDDERLKWLGRVHDKNSVFKALEALFEAGFANISIDYIVGVPGQDVATIKREISDVLTRFPGIKHVSAYLLTLKPSNAKFEQLPTDDEQLNHLRAVAATLEDFGYEHYEISNFAQPGARARHNENYWLGGGYLGIGPSAHSYWPSRKRRTKNWASLSKYGDLVIRNSLPLEWEESLSDEQQRLEYLMLRLRRRDGVELAEYKSIFKMDLLAENKSWLDLCISKGLCRIDSKLQLTTDGFFLSDQILSKIQ